MIDGLFADLKYAVRMLVRTPGFTIVAILTLAFGIGANTTVFSLLNAALFRTIDAPAPHQLVWLVGTVQGRLRGISFPEYREHRDGDSAFTGLMAYDQTSIALGSGGEPERIAGLMVTGNYFSVLQVPMQLGRAFTADEDGARNANPVVVLGDALWRRHFAADSAIVGRQVVLNGSPFTVVGVAARGFVGTDLTEDGEAWVTMAQIDRFMPGNQGMLEMRNARWIRVIGRLRPDLGIRAARARVAVTGLRLAQAWPESYASSGASLEPVSGGLDPHSRAEGIPIFALLMAVPAMVLLIACANAANLLLSRATVRRREIAVRLALGASRARLVRMLVTESLLLGLSAGALAVLCSLWLTGLVSALGEIPRSITEAVRPDGRVLAFTMTLGLLTGVLFGLVPALGATRPGVAPALKEDGPGSGRLGGSRLIKSLVVAQVAVSLVLLVIAGLFLRTLGKATRVDAGFDTRNGINLTFDLGSLGYSTARRAVFFQELLDRTSALPGVTAASLGSDLPLGEREISSGVFREGDEPPPETPGPPTGRERDENTGLSAVYPGFFRTLGIALVAGRDFTMRDDSGAPQVAVINAELARRLWPGSSPLGKRLRLGRDEPLLEVVGVTQNGKYHELTEDPQGFVYVPARQRTFTTDMTLVVRTATDPAASLRVVREVIRGLDPNLPVYNLTTLAEHVRLRLDKERGVSALLGSFGALALLLAALGLYGVMAYGVTQRTREIGIRVALGAARREVVRMVVGEGVRLAAIGIALGLVLAAVLTRVIARFLYGVTATDLTTFAAVSLVLVIVAAAASLLPARRAAIVDPIIALRAE